MPALHKNSKANLLPAIHGNVFNQPRVKPLIFKHTHPVYEKIIEEVKSPNKCNKFSYMGLVIPFQPCMWDDKKIEASWNDALEMVQTKMKGKYAAECITRLMARLKNMFGRLNFNTHRKSLAVILTHDVENIIYLSFPVRPTVFFSKSVSCLALAANIKREPDFYYLVLNKDYTTLHDFNNKQLRKVHEHKNEPCLEKSYKKVVSVLGLLNGKIEKPVFVNGSPNLVEHFCKSESCAEMYVPLLYHTAPFRIEILQTIIDEITVHWSYWRATFIAESILLAQKTNGLISHTEAVLQALRKGADGLLVIDKRLKSQIQKNVCGNTMFKMADELVSQVEKFLVRGNQLEIAKTGLLKNFGGIVLLSNPSSVISGGKVCVKRNEASSMGELF